MENKQLSSNAHNIRDNKQKIETSNTYMLSMSLNSFFDECYSNDVGSKELGNLQISLYCKTSDVL